MNSSGVMILLAALTLTGFILWYFFGTRKVRRAELEGGVQVVKVTVKGGYSPDLIEVSPGVPVRLLFDRQESGECSSRVLFGVFPLKWPLQLSGEFVYVSES